MTALYSDLYFADQSLYPSALSDLRHYQLTLVMGLDLDSVLEKDPAAWTSHGDLAAFLE